ncbi:hypothetical protein GN244_ATG03406 [Phytophthora infestans]|uniref:Uncharacterized protein n=1 Tax=Phytophthora infestans TaxID=4787 RepID=A0A833WL06_PHYIN|nr:hypothetical protein GN244_ATG03406 [Phytophthora infestans]
MDQATSVATLDMKITASLQTATKCQWLGAYKKDLANGPNEQTSSNDSTGETNSSHLKEYEIAL